nr:xylulose kinase-1 [Tanacetum cinerariifolium]
MVAILKKYEQNTDFHQIVDFVEASHIRYALTFNPTIYVSHIRQFWSTARIETTDKGTKILATVDGILRTVTESSIRRNLKLNDEEGLNELASLMRDVSQGEACPTDSGFVADQDRANIAKTSTLPYESTSRVTSLAANEGTRVKFLEDRQGEGINLSGDDTPIKERRLDEEEVATERVSSDTEEIRLDEREVAAERVSDDTEEMVTILIIMDAASVLSGGGVQVVLTAAAVALANVSISTGSGMVPTASTIISTATPIFATATTVTPYTRRKGKEKMVETHTPKKKKR